MPGHQSFKGKAFTELRKLCQHEKLNWFIKKRFWLIVFKLSPAFKMGAGSNIRLTILSMLRAYSFFFFYCQFFPLTCLWRIGNYTRIPYQNLSLGETVFIFSFFLCFFSFYGLVTGDYFNIWRYVCACAQYKFPCLRIHSYPRIHNNNSL